MPRRPRSSTPNSHYPLGTIKKLIKEGSVIIRPNAELSAMTDFAWGIDEINNAILKLKPLDFHHSDYTYIYSGCVNDVYKANINNEDIYTHFYIADGILIINSFKQL